MLHQANAMTPCPTSYFVPVYRFGMAFGDTEHFVNAQVYTSRDEELMFDYMEFETRDPGYASVYRLAMLESESEQWELVLLRQPTKPGEQGSSPKLPLVSTRKALDGKHAQAVVQTAIAILRRTHYPAEGQEIMCVDGYVAHAFVQDAGPRPVSHELVGEVYSPPHDSEAYALVQLARTLKAYTLNQADLAALDASLKLAESLLDSTRE